MPQERRIGLVLSYDYSLVTTLVEDLRTLADLGYHVDVFAPSSTNWEIDLQTDWIQIHWFQGLRSQSVNLRSVSHKACFQQVEKSFVIKWLQGIFRIVNRVPILSDIVLLMTILISLFPRWLRVTRGKQYLCFMGVEPGGLFLATISGVVRGVPVVYYNMELLLSQEIRKKHKLVLKLVERKCNRRALLTIIQDEARAGLLCQDNNIPLSRVAIMPCGSFGQCIEKRTDYLRKKFGIPVTNRIVLYATKMTSWARVAELAQQAIHWPDGWVLVIHGFPKNGEYVVKVREIISHCRGRVIISNEMLARSEFECMVSFADIGIALYTDLGANFLHTGSASMKLPAYLKYGLPVITNDSPSMREIVEGYGCGVCVHEESQVIQAAAQIMKDYERYRTNAFRCFAEHYDLTPYWRTVIGRLTATYFTGI